LNSTILTGAPTVSGNTEFELRVRQAILSAKHTIPQVAVLLFGFNLKGGNQPGEKTGWQSSILMRLRGGLRDSDTVALLPDDRIGVLLQSVQGPQDLDLVVNRLLGRLANPVQVDNESIVIQPYIGVALFPEHGDSVDKMIEHAKKDLAVAESSRKSYTTWSSSPRNLFTARQWMTALRHAIVREQFFLTFQPKIDLLKGCVTGVEVLLRWQHPEHGVIPPDQFIPVAERTGLIIPLTLWVLQQSLMQCRQWNEMGLNISVAVNLTMWNLEAQELPEQIEALLHDTRVSPKNLELEITETSIMNDPQRVIRTLNQIRQLGAHFAIDDFGTGYSSFTYLTKLPVSCIKIDKSFVQTIETDRDNSVVVKSIIDLGHNLGLNVVAEGVETANARNLLRAFHCDEGQGFYFCRPIPADAMTKFLLNPPATVKERQLVGELTSGKITTRIEGSTASPEFVSKHQ
jgi:EAL domain-containing protein (putative c-di-GMP-specific phosphodiesterase class I)/GGDEF domain-containing protein